MIDPSLCKDALAFIAAQSKLRTDINLAVLDAQLLQDHIDGEIDHDEFLLCSTVDEPVKIV